MIFQTKGNRHARHPKAQRRKFHLELGTLKGGNVVGLGGFLHLSCLQLLTPKLTPTI